MKVVWSPLAVDRVKEAALYIARDNAEAARRWAEGVFAAAAELRQFADRGRVVPELGRGDVRELLHGNYRITYRIERNRVAILTVRHGRRLLAPEELE